MINIFIPATPKSGQEEYFKALQNKDIVFVSGNAGSGKSFLALSHGLKLLLDNKTQIEKICIIRPYIFTHAEKLGALPGTLDEKVTPFVASIRDSLEQLLPTQKEVDFILRTKIEFLTLSTLRGRSLHNRYILVEEAQNTPAEGDGMLTILTRLGKNSKIVIAGDLSQSDLHEDNGSFLEAINALQSLDEVAYIEMNDMNCIHRNRIIGKILKCFQDFRRRDI